VPALEPSEVLESLVREAEPILEQLGVSNAKGTKNLANLRRLTIIENVVKYAKARGANWSKDWLIGWQGI
jgi:hypothetical protein